MRVYWEVSWVRVIGGQYWRERFGVRLTSILRVYAVRVWELYNIFLRFVKNIIVYNTIVQ